MEIDKLDLNLLKVLLALLQEPNTHRAAEQLNTSQPAVSRSLGKLRDAFGDPLFVRHNRGLKLTPRAEELAKTLPLIFSELEKALQNRAFLPGEMTGRFRIALNGFLIESYGAEIYRLFKRECPKVQLELYSFSDSTVSHLIDGNCDLAITYQPLQTPKEVYQKNIARSRFGFICRRGVVPENQPISIEELDNYRWASLVVPGFNSQLELVKKYVKLDTQPAFRSQHAYPIINAMEEEDMLLVAPYALYRVVDQNKFQFIDVDESSQTFRRDEMDIVMAYNQRYRNTEKYQWLEKEIRKLRVCVSEKLADQK